MFPAVALRGSVSTWKDRLSLGCVVQGYNEWALDIGDRNVFDGEITIEDDMAVLVRHASGASMSYHLTAYSPWRGYRVMFNGSAGRLELRVMESRWQPRRTRIEPVGGGIHGEVAMASGGSVTITLQTVGAVG